MEQLSREQIKNNKVKKEKKKKAKTRLIVLGITTLLSLISGLYLIYNIYKLTNIENFLRLVVCCVIAIIVLLFIVIGIKVLINHKKKSLVLFMLFSIIFIGITGFINYNMQLVYSKIANTNSNYKTYTLSLVTKKSNKATSIEDIDNTKIGIINDKEISNGYNMGVDILDEEGLDNKLVGYDTYLEIVEALYSGKLTYAFLPESYDSMFTSYTEYKNIKNELKTIYTKEKKEKEDSVQKNINEPFTVLLMGVDTLENSYNADTLLVVTFNPKTLSTTMVSIPRDTYTTIACTGGKHKINSSGWYGDKCVVNTVAKYLDVNIDYYAKVNFNGIVKLVDAIDGVDVDVPYALCEQDSQRRFGKYMIYVEEGLQHLSGEQALALSRNRHYWTGYCPVKYTKDGDRSDFQRGRNQQLVFKGILQKLTSVKKIDTLYSLLDTLSENITTNMDTDTMLSFYNVGKEIMKKLDNNTIDEVINIKRLGFTSSTPSVRISGLLLSMVVNSDSSVKAVQTAMKQNLGLIKKDSIKECEFDINNPYEEKIIGTNVSGKTSLNLLPDFTSYTLQEAINYLTRNGISYKTDPTEKISGTTYKIIAQTPLSYTDIDTMNKSKGVTLYIKSTSTTSSNTFDYSTCLGDNKDDSRCEVPNATNISVFNTWVNKVKSYISGISFTSTKNENYGTIEGNITKIVDNNGKSVIGLSLYKLNKSSITSINAYYDTVKPKDDETNTDNNTGNNNNNDDTTTTVTP